MLTTSDTHAATSSNSDSAWPEWLESGNYDAIDTWTAKNGQTYYVVTKGRSITAYTAEPNLDDVRHGGYVTWGGWNPTIGNMSVHPDHQRQGIATELLRRAREIDPDLRHSDRLSNDAQAWIRAIGDEIPSSTVTPVTHRSRFCRWSPLRWSPEREEEGTPRDQHHRQGHHPARSRSGRARRSH